jgi:hypothetical protein
VSVDFVAPEDVPHVAEYLNQSMEGQSSRAAVENKMGEKLGLSAYPNSKREARERAENRPVSDPAPYGFGDEPSAESEPAADIRTDAEKLEDGLDKLFGTDKPQPERSAPKPEPQRAAAKPDPVVRHDSEAIWTPQDVELISRCEIERQHLDQYAARFNELIAQRDRVDPSQLNDFDLNLSLARQELERRSAALNGALEGIRNTYQSRQRSRAEQLVASEAQKLKAALPDLDIAKTRAYGLKYGFSEQEIDSLADHRHVTILEKARRYDELQRQPKPKTVRRVSRSSQDKQTLQRAHRTGNYEGAEAALDRRLSELFR